MINTTHLFKTDCVNDFHSNHPEVLKIILKSLDPLLIKNKKIDENLIQSILKELQSGSKTLNENDICFT